MRHVRQVLIATAAAATVVAAALPAGASSTSAEDAVDVYRQDVPPLAKIGSTTITGGAYGSSLTAKPGSDQVFYGLTDRGPNVDGPNGEKIEPLPKFQPAIGEFRLGPDGKATLVKRIGLKGADGTAYNGQVNTEADTGETIVDRDGKTLPPSPYGYDSEGLAVARDGSFWVSDEYGPFITHFDAAGRQISRFSPSAGLPKELAEREANKGMEGLTLTPDGRTLVGIMQAGINAPDNTGVKSKNISALRIVTVDLRTKRTHEYVYVLHNSDGADTAVSEISALNGHEFLVDERDGNLEPGADKKLYKVDISRATDIGPQSDVDGATYDGAKGGLLIGGRSIEKIAGTGNTDDTTSALDDAGVKVADDKRFLDVGSLVTAVDGDGKFFGHDKVEGVAVVDGGSKVVISNDSDFGVDGITNAAPPYDLHTKTLPNEQQDDGEFLVVDMDKVPSEFR